MIRAAFMTLLLSFPLAGHAQQPLPEGTYQVAQNRTSQDVVAALEYEGYLIDTISRTLLGRIQIKASNTIHERRIVMSRTTGEILSDTITAVYQNDETSNVSSPGVSVSGNVTVGVNSNKPGLQTETDIHLQVDID